MHWVGMIVTFYINSSACLCIIVCDINLYNCQSVLNLFHILLHVMWTNIGADGTICTSVANTNCQNWYLDSVNTCLMCIRWNNLTSIPSNVCVWMLLIFFLGAVFTVSICISVKFYGFDSYAWLKVYMIGLWF